MRQYQARDILLYSQDQLWSIPEEDIEVVFDDGVVSTFTQALVFSSYCWDTHKRFPLTPLLRAHICKDEILTRGSHLHILSAINRCCYEHYKAIGIHVPMGDLARIAFVATNNLYNELGDRLESCMSSISAIDLVAIMTHPDIFAANEYVKSLAHATKSDTDACNAAAEHVLLNDVSLRYNNIVKGARSGIIRMNQVLQCVSSRGAVSDIDSSIFRSVITTGYAEGFKQLADSMADSRSAARSLLMTKGAMRDAEYTNRQIQLTATAVKHVTHGNCGSTAYIEVRLVSRRILYDMEGIFFLDESTGCERALTRADTKLIYETIKIRNVFGCLEKRSDTICGHCFGELYYSIPLKANVGYIAAVMVQSPTGQLILSNKHYEGSSAVIDAVFSEEDRQYIHLGEGTNDLYFTRAFHGIKFSIRIDRDQARNLNDVYSVDDVSKLPIQRTTSISAIQIDHTLRGTDTVVPVVVGLNCGTRMASLSVEMLTYVRAKGWTIDVGGAYTIDMCDWDVSQPFARLPLKNFSTEEYAKAIETFIMGGQSVKDGGVKGIIPAMKYESPAAAVAAFHELISQKLSVHHVYLQVLIMSMMTTNIAQKDYNIPKDRRNGILGHYNKVVANRSAGPGYAYERQVNLVYSPFTFLVKNKPSNPLDDLYLE